MSAECFINTNVFVYQLDRSDTRKALIAEELIERGIAEGTTCISFQVVQECLNTMLRKAKVSASVDELRDYLQSVLMPLYKVQPGLSLYLGALDIQTNYRFSFYDSLIVAAALPNPLHRGPATRSADRGIDHRKSLRP